MTTSTKLTDPQHDALLYLIESGHAGTRSVANYLYDKTSARNIVSSAHNILNHLLDKGLVTFRTLGNFEGTRWEPTIAGRRALGYTADFSLTIDQLLEVTDLLDICRHRQVMGDRQSPPWGTLVGTNLTVTDRGEAAADIRARANYLSGSISVIQTQSQTVALVRSLNLLANLVAMPGPPALARLMATK